MKLDDSGAFTVGAFSASEDGDVGATRARGTLQVALVDVRLTVSAAHRVVLHAGAVLGATPTHRPPARRLHMTHLLTAVQILARI